MAWTRPIRTFLAAGTALAWTTTSLAQEHVVSAETLRARLLEARAQHAAERARLQALLASAAQDGNAIMRPGAQRAMRAVACLSDAELRDLAARADVLAADPAAGRLSDGQIWLISVGGALLLLTAALIAYNSCDEQCRNSPW